MKRYNEKKLKILITANLEKVLLSQKKRKSLDSSSRETGDYTPLEGQQK